jgi:hypothetical protein
MSMYAQQAMLLLQVRIHTVVLHVWGRLPDSSILSTEFIVTKDGRILKAHSRKHEAVISHDPIMNDFTKSGI